MTVSSTRRIINRFLDDLGELTLQSVVEATNADSVAAETIEDLEAGANTITVPTGAVGVTIILPSENTETLTLKGVSGDTGIALALTAPVSLSLSSVASFVLTAGDAIEGVRFVWS